MKSGLSRNERAKEWFRMKSSTSKDISSGGLNMTTVSASEGGVIRPLIAGIAGAVAMMKPAVVKKIDTAPKAKRRARRERRLDRAARVSTLLVLSLLPHQQEL